MSKDAKDEPTMRGGTTTGKTGFAVTSKRNRPGGSKAVGRGGGKEDRRVTGPERE